MVGGSITNEEQRAEAAVWLGPSTWPQKLSNEFGGDWTGVRFDYDAIPSGPVMQSKSRLCGAIAQSFRGRLILPASLVSCPGALRSLGLGPPDEDLIRQISENTRFPASSVARAVSATPRLMDPVVSITLGAEDPFDVAVGYTPPAVAMNVLRRWQAISGGPLAIGLSTFMAICGNALVAAHESGRIQVSLGCPTSRGEGVLAHDAVVIAIPWHTLEALFPRSR